MTEADVTSAARESGPSSAASGASGGTPDGGPTETRPPELDWLEALDFEKPARSAVGAWVRMIAWTAALIWLYMVVRKGTALVTVEHRPTPQGGESHAGFHWGIPLEKRQAIFAELAAGEVAERERAIAGNTWAGHPWSREDDRGYQEMNLARSLALKYGVTLSQVYLILDEGIREKWPGPDGQPLIATTPPQDPRSTW